MWQGVEGDRVSFEVDSRYDAWDENREAPAGPVAKGEKNKNKKTRERVSLSRELRRSLSLRGGTVPKD